MASILIILTLAFLTTARADLIDVVCSKTSNLSSCSGVLRSEARSKGADLTTLGEIVLQKAIAASDGVITTVKSIGQSEPVDACVSLGAEAIGDLKQCSAWLPPRDATAVNFLLTKGWEAMLDINDCTRSFGNQVPEKVKAAALQALDILGIFMAVANTF